MTMDLVFMVYLIKQKPIFLYQT